MLLTLKSQFYLDYSVFTDTSIITCLLLFFAMTSYNNDVKYRNNHYVMNNNVYNLIFYLLRNIIITLHS